MVGQPCQRRKKQRGGHNRRVFPDWVRAFYCDRLNGRHRLDSFGIDDNVHTVFWSLTCGCIVHKTR